MSYTFYTWPIQAILLFETSSPTSSSIFNAKRVQRDSAEKNSKYRPNELMAMNEDHDPVILYLPYLLL